MIKYCYSHNSEIYHGQFDTREQALAEAGRPCWTGRCVPPSQPETYWYAEDWLEHVSCQDDYHGDAACDWECSNRKQREELEEEVRSVLAAWLDRHGLRPAFWLVEEVQRHERQGE